MQDFYRQALAMENLQGNAALTLTRAQPGRHKQVERELRAVIKDHPLLQGAPEPRRGDPV